MHASELQAELFRRLAEPFTAEALFDCLPDVVFFIKNSRSEYVVVNQTLVERCGRRTKQELLGRTADEVFPPPLGRSYRLQDDEVPRGGHAIRDQLELHFYPTGRCGWCVTNKLPLRARDGALVGLYGVSKDLQATEEDGEDFAQIAAALARIRSRYDQPLHVGELARGLFSLPAALGKSPANWSESTRLAGLVILTTLPGAIVGLLFKDAIEKMFSNLVLTGAFFLVSGAVLALTKWARVGNDDVNWKTALMIGLAQAAAVLPGLSRSGCTIGVAILLGVQRARAGEYSFIAAVPIVLGAVLVEVPDIARQSSHGGVLPMVLAFLASFAVGCLALLWLLRVIRHGRFHWFAPYCFLIGIVTLLIAR